MPDHNARTDSAFVCLQAAQDAQALQQKDAQCATLQAAMDAQSQQSGTRIASLEQVCS